MNTSEPVIEQPTVNASDVNTADKLQLLPQNEACVTSESLPDGLKLLAQCKEVTVSQHIDPVEVVLGCFARPCRYSVYSDQDEDQFLYVQEVSECYARQIMGAARGFSLKFSDNNMVDVIRAMRTQTCSRGCCGICCCTLPSIQVQSPPGHAIATMTERRTCCCPVYEMTDGDGQTMFSLHPNCCYSGVLSVCCQDIIINITDGSENLAAQLLKQSRGNIKEFIGQTNNFCIKYLQNLTVTQKAALLGSMFLIDFHYFERQNRCCC